MMDPNAILGLLSDLYGQINHMAQQNAELTRLLAERQAPASTDDLDGLYRPPAPSQETTP